MKLRQAKKIMALCMWWPEYRPDRLPYRWSTYRRALNRCSRKVLDQLINRCLFPME